MFISLLTTKRDGNYSSLSPRSYIVHIRPNLLYDSANEQSSHIAVPLDLRGHRQGCIARHIKVARGNESLLRLATSHAIASSIDDSISNKVMHQG